MFMKQIQELAKEYEVYVNTQESNLSALSMEGIPFKIRYINALLPESAEWYKREIADLDNEVFGPKGMFSPPWIDITFSGMAGAAVGLKEKNGPVVSIARFCGSLKKEKVQLWTLMTYPKVQGKGLGTVTLALMCAINQRNREFQYITQIENPAIKLYLKLITPDNPLKLSGMGFYHSQMPNSIAMESRIPEKPFHNIGNGLEPPKGIEHAKLINSLKSKEELHLNELYLVPSKPENSFISNDILEGATYHVIWWLDSYEAKEFGVKEPLLVVRKAGSITPMMHNGVRIG